VRPGQRGREGCRSQPSSRTTWTCRVVLQNSCAQSSNSTPDAGLRYWTALRRAEPQGRRSRVVLVPRPRTSDPLIVPSPVLAEVCWRLESRVGRFGRGDVPTLGRRWRARSRRVDRRRRPAHSSVGSSIQQLSAQCGRRRRSRHRGTPASVPSRHPGSRPLPLSHARPRSGLRAPAVVRRSAAPTVHCGRSVHESVHERPPVRSRDGRHASADVSVCSATTIT
jgi:hypothetical protein